jgi:hypothetical protein
VLNLGLKPTHASVKTYYEALHGYGQLHINHEMAVRSAFQDLLSACGRKLKLTLVPEFEIKRKYSSIRVDGALLDAFHLAHGFWEAKDEKDDLDRGNQSQVRQRLSPRQHHLPGSRARRPLPLYQRGREDISPSLSIGKSQARGAVTRRHLR